MSEEVKQSIKKDTVTDTAHKKLAELLTCGNERVELSAAKELLAINEKDAEKSDGGDVKLEVTIKIV